MTRTWLYVAAAGCALVMLALVVVGLVLVDKPHFGWLVGTGFLPSITIGVFIGAVLLAVAAWNLPVRRTWRGAVLFVWAAVALTSPLFGIMFLLPWGLLLLSLPVVVAILIKLRSVAEPNLHV
jgi:hypothetical protein